MAISVLSEEPSRETFLQHLRRSPVLQDGGSPKPPTHLQMLCVCEEGVCGCEGVCGVCVGVRVCVGCVGVDTV